MKSLDFQMRTEIYIYVFLIVELETNLLHKQMPLSNLSYPL